MTAEQVLSGITRSSQWSNGGKGADERDMMFARLFAIVAVVDSGVVFADSGRLEDFVTVLDSLAALSETKVWIAEAAGWAVQRTVELLLALNVSWKKEAIAQVVEKFYSDKIWTPEKIALTLAIADAPGIDLKSLLAPTFKHTPLLAAGNLVTLGRVLKEGGVDEEDSATRTGSYKPQLHYVWDSILAAYFLEEEAATGIAPFAEFFRVVVDESLFANTASAERKYWGFQVFERALPKLPASSMPLIFTPNFMRSWINNLSSADRHLHKAAMSAARVVQEQVKANPAAGITLLSQLVGKHGRPDFDRVTKTKTVESIMANLTPEGASEYVAYLEQVALGSDTDKSDAAGLEERRVWALDQLVALCRNRSVPKTDDWVARVLDFLLVHSFFIVRKADKKSSNKALHSVPKPPFSEATAAAARSRFASAIIDVTAAAPKDGRAQGTDAAGKLWLTRALETIATLENDKKHVEVMSDADDEIKAIRTAARKVLSSIPEKNDTGRGVQILLSFLLLQTYDEVEDALDLLEDAVGAAEGLFGKKKQATDADAPAPIDALLDGLVALLDKSSADLRALANLVFGLVAPALTSSSIQHLVAQLEQSGAAQEADAEGSENDDDEEEDEDDDDDESDAASSIAVESDDEDDEVDPEFRKRVAEALKVSGMATADGEGEDDDSDDESVWDDDQMMKIDDQLAAVFKAQGNSKKRSDLKHAAIESLHFKNRILDFFDTFARRQCASPLALDILTPLLRLTRAGGDLANKAAGILRTRIAKAAHAPSPSAVDAAHAKVVIDEIHALARKAPTAEFSTLCSTAALFAARAAPTVALEAYKATLADFMTRKQSDVQAAFVAEYVRRHPAKAWALATDLIGYVAPSAEATVKPYRQVQAYAMLSTLATQLSALVKAGDVSAADAEKVIKGAMADVYASLETAATDGGKADRLKEVVKSALVFARAAKALDGARAAELCDASRLATVAEQVKNGKTKEMKGVHSLLKQLGSMLGQKQEKEAKKASKKEAATQEAEEETAKPKKRKAEDKTTEKAESKKLKAKAKKAKA